MIIKNSFKDRSRVDAFIGSWITIPSPIVAEIMASAGFDWLAVDLEHSTINIDQAQELIRIIELKGVSPLVRLTSNNADLIKRVMDAGAHGVIVPMINTVEEAKRIVDAVYYPPKGNRGVGLARAQGYGASFNEHREWLDSNAIIIVQIEHIDGVKNAEEILSVDGIDGYIIGPYDLSASMGLIAELEHPDVLAAIQRVKNAAENCGKPGGIHIVEPNKDKLKAVIDDGAKFVAYSVDIRMLDVACREGLKVLASNKQSEVLA